MIPIVRRTFAKLSIYERFNIILRYSLGLWTVFFRSFPLLKSVINHINMNSEVLLYSPTVLIYSTRNYYVLQTISNFRNTNYYVYVYISN